MKVARDEKCNEKTTRPRATCDHWLRKKHGHVAPLAQTNMRVCPLPQHVFRHSMWEKIASQQQQQLRVRVCVTPVQGRQRSRLSTVELERPGRTSTHCRLVAQVCTCYCGQSMSANPDPLVEVLFHLAAEADAARREYARGYLVAKAINDGNWQYDDLNESEVELHHQLHTNRLIKEVEASQRIYNRLATCNHWLGLQKQIRVRSFGSLPRVGLCCCGQHTATLDVIDYPRWRDLTPLVYTACHLAAAAEESSQKFLMAEKITRALPGDQPRGFVTRSLDNLDEYEFQLQRDYRSGRLLRDMLLAFTEHSKLATCNHWLGLHRPQVRRPQGLEFQPQVRLQLLFDLM